MGTLRLQLPAQLSAEAVRDLDCACVTSGYDNMPGPVRVAVENGQLTVGRDAEESGYLAVPWLVEGTGRVMGSTATLIERPAPYRAALELARGKVNQVRNQVADWQGFGMQIGEDLDACVGAAGLAFSKAVTAGSADETDRHAQAALSVAHDAAGRLVREYVEQIIAARHLKHPRLETLLGVRVNAAMPQLAADAVAAAFNSICLPMTWRLIEPAESQYNWGPTEAALAWALERKLTPVAGPLIDFSLRGLPDWLWLWEGDLHSLANNMCDYVETAVGKFRHRVRRWQLTAGANAADVLKLSEDDLLWLNARLAEAAWQVDPDLELVIGLALPWGDYMAREETTYSPFIFADTLIRAGLKLAALDLEWVMGVSPRGSYCRDLLEASRLLDLYALLGVPIQVTLAYPSADGPDPHAGPAALPGAGHWLTGYSPETQADWAAAFAALAVAKPFVRGVYWAHLTDADEHDVPHGGLIDAAGRPKPALEMLRQIREAHLR